MKLEIMRDCYEGCSSQCMFLRVDRSYEARCLLFDKRLKEGFYNEDGEEKEHWMPCNRCHHIYREEDT